MKRIKKILLYFIGFIFLLGAGILLFINLHPAFGGSPTQEQKVLYQQSTHYDNGKFVNVVATRFIVSSPDPGAVNTNTDSDKQDRSPSGQIPVSTVDWDKVNGEEDSLTWFGHSAVLLSIDNKKLLIDPMLGPMASPVSFAGVKRYPYSEDILQNIIEQMPSIDAVLITHDHYDHLDYPSILKLKSKASHFFVPLGVSNHLIRWGISKDRITELNWQDETEYLGLKIALTPARHFSGRGLFDRNTTLWGGWVILGKNTRLFNSGDGGYGPHFQEIGQKYGPFNITMIEGAQYNARWPDIHMTPEESVQAHLDVVGRNMMLMHWGAFTLASHGWKEPMNRAVREAQQKNVNLIAPKIGETLMLKQHIELPISTWW